MPTALPFGNTTIDLPLPGQWTEGPRPRPEPLADPGSALARALAAPAAGPPLGALASRARRVVLSLPDLTRPFPVGRDLAVLLDVLNEAGVPDASVRALIATGVHRPLDDAERSVVLGSAAGRIGARNHDPAADLTDLGVTARGTPVAVSREGCACDLLVVVGSVAFHFHAGFGGGPKGIVPGLAGAETARVNHLLALSGPDDSWHPGCGPGRLDGNPVHEDLMEAAGRVPPPVFLVNYLPARDGLPFGLAAGSLREAHRDACRRWAETFETEVDEPYDVVLVSAGGHPRDVNLIQAHKAAAHAAGALSHGGTLALLARCPEGLGHPDLDFWFGRPQAALKGLSRETGRTYVQTAFSFQDKAARFRFLLLSDLPAAPLLRAGIVPVASADALAREIRARHGDDFRGLVVRGTNVLFHGASGRSRPSPRPA